MNKGKISVKTIITAILLLSACATAFGASVITVNTSSSQGSLMYGGIGFLYGLAMNTPSDAMITGLVHPQFTGQNAPNGAQHPDGYADRVLSQAQRTGFKGVYVCCQDIYAGWPYPNNGINDFLSKLTTMANTFKGNSMIIYNIFNEPNINWYATSGTGLTNMCNDWKTCYDRIKSIDPSAKTMGPSFSYYAGSALKTFFDFCRNNNCMPDYAVWHELGDDFYTSWYSHYNDFRNNVNSTIPININEYSRQSGDYANPGNLIQHLAKYENSNVYACLAYWNGHGTLNDLVANNNTNQQAIGSSYNQPTGAWYLYQWYGQMTGNQVAVTLPSQEGSLQAIASKDGNNVTILFGGGTSTFDVNVVVQGLSGSSANYTVWETANTGRNTASAPGTKISGTASVSGGSATISVTGCQASSAFKIAITTADSPTAVPTSAPTPTPTVTGKGDVNSNGVVDITDSLLIAQYYVGLNPQNFNTGVADVNCSGGIDIVDALLIAQYYVGLVTGFPC